MGWTLQKSTSQGNARHLPFRRERLFLRLFDFNLFVFRKSFCFLEEREDNPVKTG